MEFLAPLDDGESIGLILPIRLGTPLVGGPHTRV